MKFQDYLAEELPFRAWLDYYLDPDETRIVFEVGACEAEDTIKLSRTYHKASVFAFEPLPKNVSIAKEHIKKYDAERTKLFELALSDRAGEANFFVSSGQPPGVKDPDWDYGNKSSSLLKPGKATSVHQWLKFSKEIKVKTERLDNFCQLKGIKDIDLLYVDVQGAELMVLKGAGKLLSNIKAVWLEVEAVELYKDQPLKNKVEQFMKKAGFVRIMDTVDKISGDQLYIHSDLVAKVNKEKSTHPESRLKTVEKVLFYTDDIWAKPFLAEDQRNLLSEHIEWLNLEKNELQDNLSDKPPLSVVMGVQNNTHLKTAVESILNQSYKDFELIIVDDGSAHSSIKTIRNFKDKRIRLIPQTSRGLAYSLNKGVRIARSSIIAKMDADGIALPDRFSKQLSQLKKNHRIGGIGSFFTFVDGPTDHVAGGAVASPIKPIDIKRELYYVSNKIPRGGSMFHRKAFDEAGGYSEKYIGAEDHDLWQRMADRGWDLTQIPEVLYQQRLSPQNISDTSIEGRSHATSQLVNERWRKPLIKKSLIKIIKDGKYYRRMNSQYSNEIHRQYIYDQFTIATGLFARGRFGSGLVTMIGIGGLDYRLFGKLFRPATGGFLRMLGLREKVS